MKKIVIAQGACPKCGEELDYHDSTFEGDGIYYECECVECGFIGKEWYNCQFAGFSDDSDPEGALIAPPPSS